MKTLIFSSKERVEKYSKYCNVPEGMELVFLDKSCSDDEALRLAGDAEFIVTDVIKKISSYLIKNMPKLKLIHSEGVGFDKIDIETARELNIYVCNNKGANAAAVAEQTIFLMLAVLRNALEGDSEVRKGHQIETKERMMLSGITELGDCTVGLVGFGAIGKETAKRLASFGAKTYYYNRTRMSEEIEKEYRVEYRALEALLPVCDIVSLHLAVAKETANIVDKNFIDKMKQNAILINTARGELVNQMALKEALISNKLMGAGLDTLSPEPVTLDNPLLNLPEESKYKLFFSPHIGGTTDGAFRRMHQCLWENINRCIKGERPINIANNI